MAQIPRQHTPATGSADWTMRLWDLKTQKQRAALKGHQGSVTSLAFSKVGLLASGSGDQTIKLWNPETATLRGHRSGVTSVAFAPSGKSLASAGVDDTIPIWELAPQ